MRTRCRIVTIGECLLPVSRRSLPEKYTSPRRGAYRRGCIVSREAHPLIRKSREIRRIMEITSCIEAFVHTARQTTPPQVICKDEDNVGWSRCLCGNLPQLNRSQNKYDCKYRVSHISTELLVIANFGCSYPFS